MNGLSLIEQYFKNGIYCYEVNLMDKSLIEKYKAEMLKMYKPKITKTAIPTVANESNPEKQATDENSSGELTALVTTLRSIYPVKNAKVTVFTGNPDNMNIIDTDYTDESGRTKSFVLSAPSKELSQNSGDSNKPYSSYNMLVQSDGYIDNVHLNIPVFSGVNSLQSSNMMLYDTAGENKGPQIFDESQSFYL